MYNVITNDLNKDHISKDQLNAKVASSENKLSDVNGAIEGSVKQLIASRAES